MKLPDTDKMGHFGGGAAVAGVAAAIALAALYGLRAPLWLAIPIAFAAAFAAGRWKERRDARTGGDVETGDWQATTWGATPVVLPILVLVVLALLSGKVLANGGGKPGGPSANPSANASAAASASAAPGTVNGGDYSVIALPGGGAAAPSVVCVRWRWYGWGIYGSQDADQECLRLVAELERMRATPVPAAPVTYVSIDLPKDGAPASPADSRQTCTPPAKARSVAAAKAAGSCRP